MGLVFSIFAFGYTLFEVPTEWLGDRYGQRKTISRIVIWWSLFTVLTGLAHRLSTMLAVRFLFAAGEAGAYPNMTRVVANWFPTKSRGFAMGTVWMGSRLGAALTPPLALFLIRGIGWRESFYVLGAMGIVWAIFWRRWFRDRPAEVAAVNQAELNLIAEGQGSRSLWGRSSRRPGNACSRNGVSGPLTLCISPWDSSITSSSPGFPPTCSKSAKFSCLLWVFTPLYHCCSLL